MTYDWLDLFHLASQLVRLSGREGAPKADVNNKETYLRTAISRAYYSTFCRARNYLESKGETVEKTGKAHDIVPSKFQQIDQEISRNLRRLRQDRRKADYEDKIDEDIDGMTDKALEEANLIHERLDRLVSTP